MNLKNNEPVQFPIYYDIDSEDGKIPAEIIAAKFFLARTPGELDNKYFLKTYNNGLTYLNGVWTVTVDQGDFTEETKAFSGPYRAVLAIQYNGDSDYREPELYENGKELVVYIKPSYAT